MSGLDEALRKLHAGANRSQVSPNRPAIDRIDGTADMQIDAESPRPVDASPHVAEVPDEPDVIELYREVENLAEPASGPVADQQEALLVESDDVEIAPPEHTLNTAQVEPGAGGQHWLYDDVTTRVPPPPHADFSRNDYWTEVGANDEPVVSEIITPDSESSEETAPESPSIFKYPGTIEEQTLRIDPVHTGRLKPAFEVDRFAWPEPCSALLESAETQIARLSEALAADGRLGHKTWYFTSTRRKEGRTTLALCVARYLAERGVSIALVDADFHNPQLARRLGVLAQVGWERVLGGSTSLCDAMIQASGSGVTLLPLVSAHTDVGDSATKNRIGETLSQLRNQFSLVIVDGGPCAEGDFDPNREGRSDYDAALVLRDVRNTPLGELAATQRRVAEAGIAYGAVAETFASEA